MAKGKVKWFNDLKGYGFITMTEGEGDMTKDVFVHHSAIVGAKHRTLKENQEVEFNLEISPKGNKAAEVKKGELPK